MADGEYRTVTDVDVLAVRIPGAGRDRDDVGGSFVSIDPDLDVDLKRIDLIIAEVKEGRAELNASAHDPKVLRAALNRFGALGEDRVSRVIADLLDDGEADHPDGPRVRLMAFGARPPTDRNATYRWRLLGDLAGFMHRRINENWGAAQSIQSKDPALSFLLLLEKAVRGEASSR